MTWKMNEYNSAHIENLNEENLVFAKGKEKKNNTKIIPPDTTLWMYETASISSKHQFSKRQQNVPRRMNNTLLGVIILDKSRSSTFPLVYSIPFDSFLIYHLNNCLFQQRSFMLLYIFTFTCLSLELKI